VVAVRQARRGRAGGPTHDLVAEADPEHRDPAERRAGQLHGPVQHRRVARSVRQHQAVGAARLHVRPCGGVRHHDHPAASLAKRAQDVGLDAVVDDGHEQAGAVAPPAGPQLGRQRLEPLFLFRPRGLGDQVLLRKRRHAFRGGHELVEPCLRRGGGLMDQDRPLRSIDSDMARESTGVDLRDRRNVPPSQVLVERRFARVMAGRGASPAHDQRARPRTRRFGVGVAHAVVALQGVCHTDHLTGIRRVGQHLLVTRHGSVEYDLSLTQGIGPERHTDEGAAVLEHEYRKRLLSRQRSPPGRFRLPRP